MPIEVRILPDKVTVTSFPGPDRSIRKEDIEQYRFLARRYRNRRIGEFLKELELTEGRGTGIPKILRKVKVNGSPMPCFITDDDRSYFIVEFPIHPVFLPEKIDKVKSSGKGSGKSSGKSSNKILVLLRKTSSLTIPELSKKLNISTRAVEKHIQALKKAGKLKRMGSRKEGWWEVVE
jgi:ATP-dependent DNA helicase RecG